jgi:aspartyl-tRNA(Asn)/glutamyl-tRNA(Gln) amidotransferase subunit A
VVYHRPGTVVLGCLARSVRDAARHYDVCAGTTLRDPWSLPSPGGWEAGLGSHDLRGLKVGIVPTLGGCPLDDGVEEHLRERAMALIDATGMVPVDLELPLPNLTAHWALGNLSTLLADLGGRWPGCAGELTDEIAAGLVIAQTLYNLHIAAAAESLRAEANEAMATAFEQVDLIVAATNPGPAFPAEATMSRGNDDLLGKAMAHPAAKLGFRGLMGAVRTAVGVAPKLADLILTQATQRVPDMVEMGALTIISNVYGNPAVSIPAGEIGGLPVGMQVLARHHADALLFDVALAAEREMPWPKVAPPVTAAVTGS